MPLGKVILGCHSFQPPFYRPGFRQAFIMLRDDEKLHRLELEKMFGVDFGGPEKRGVHLV